MPGITHNGGSKPVYPAHVLDIKDEIAAERRAIERLERAIDRHQADIETLEAERDTRQRKIDRCVSQLDRATVSHLEARAGVSHPECRQYQRECVGCGAV